MPVQKGRNFIAILLGVVLLGAWFSGQNQQMNKAPVALAQTSAPVGATATVPETSVVPSNESPAANSDFQNGYKEGYRDAQQDCSSTRAVARTHSATRVRSAGRVRVAGVRYYAEGRRGHSTRNMILRIAAPAAIGAGIGAIAGGGKGAGAGALIGGGAGALYQLIKHRD
jgi:hypothetical protein